MTKPAPGAENSVVNTVFEDFINALTTDKTIDPTRITRLKSALLVQRDLSADAIRQALFYEDPLP
jgi:hypothetical protein